MLKARPAELKVRDYLGYLYEESKEFPKALEAYQFNIQLDPSYADSHMHLEYCSIGSRPIPLRSST